MHFPEIQFDTFINGCNCDRARCRISLRLRTDVLYWYTVKIPEIIPIRRGSSKGEKIPLSLVPSPQE